MGQRCHRCRHLAWSRSGEPCHQPRQRQALRGRRQRHPVHPWRCRPRAHGRGGAVPLPQPGVRRCAHQGRSGVPNIVSGLRGARLQQLDGPASGMVADDGRRTGHPAAGDILIPQHGRGLLGMGMERGSRCRPGARVPPDVRRLRLGAGIDRVGKHDGHDPAVVHPRRGRRPDGRPHPLLRPTQADVSRSRSTSAPRTQSRSTPLSVSSPPPSPATSTPRS